MSNEEIKKKMIKKISIPINFSNCMHKIKEKYTMQGCTF